MSIITPSDQNLFQGSKYQLTFIRLPYVNWFLQDINIPGIETHAASQVTPFIDAPLPPDKMTYESFSMTFLIDEQLWSWTTVSDWLKGMTFPDNFEEYKNLSLQQQLQLGSKTPQYSDAILTIFSNKNNPILSLNFQDMFPITLSGINLSVKDDAQVIKTATAEFKFTNYQISRQI